jgi:hypothetical protein
MKKLTLIVAVSLGLLMVFLPVNGETDVAEFTLTATIPAANGVDIVATKVDSQGTADPTDDVWTAGDYTTMNFNPRRFVPDTNLNDDIEANIWVSNIYFAVDFYMLNGGGSAGVSISYQSISALDIGNRITVTPSWAPKDGGDEVPQSPILLQSASSINYDSATYNLRLYVGVYDGAVALTGGLPFTNADLSGAYDGQLTITAVPQ